ncbi:O-methylsterigmatocystin oxidoreductase, partial [Leucoagaricus sp. SymC.cos]
IARAPLPPGPRKFPIIKNLLDVPQQEQWMTFARWSGEYNSDIIHVEAAGNSIVILSSHTAMNDLLHKRSAIYSSRALSGVICDIVGWKWLMVLTPYNEAFKEKRRMFAKYCQPSDTSFHRTRETQQLHILLNLMIDQPENLLSHLRHMIGAMVITLAYGIEVEKTDDPYVQLAENVLGYLSQKILPGTFLADTFSWLRYVPEGFPGTRWKSVVRQMQREMDDFVNKPFEASLKAAEVGTLTDCVVSRCQHDVSQSELSKEEQDIVVKELAGQLYIGGTESMASIISTFFLALVCFPEVCKEAQAEVDRVLKGRLSENADMNSLPYLNALLKEVYRWEPVFPLGLAHATTEDDTYKGYHIPKGSVVIPNIWAVFHDPKLFPEPEKVKPERFLKDGKLHVPGPDPAELTFGFGRRACQGRYIVESTLLHIAASTLSLFDITKVMGPDGKTIEPTREYSSGLARKPLPFKCSIRPRSEEAIKLIRSLS